MTLTKNMKKLVILSIAATMGLLPYLGYPRTLNALQCLNAVVPEKK